jgi:hypothetical protein
MLTRQHGWGVLPVSNEPFAYGDAWGLPSVELELGQHGNRESLADGEAKAQGVGHDPSATRSRMLAATPEDVAGDNESYRRQARRPVPSQLAGAAMDRPCLEPFCCHPLTRSGVPPDTV